MARNAEIQHSTPTKASYGLDAPGVVRNLAVIGVALLIGGVLLRSLHLPSAIIATMLATGILCVVEAVYMVYSSYAGKFRERDRLLDSLQLRGDETVLDLGCGRGLLLLGAAKRLPNGKAIGVDLWQTQDQSGNAVETTEANARAEGVADRIELHTADMRSLPLEDASVDAVVSSLAIHNIPDADGRATAVREAFRVLKPNGRCALLDFRCTGDYAATLRASGAEDVHISGPRFNIFPPVRVVTAHKPVAVPQPAGTNAPAVE